MRILVVGLKNKPNYQPSDDVADLGLADCPPSVTVEGESRPWTPVPFPSGYCESVTLICGSRASDMAAWGIPCVHLKLSFIELQPKLLRRVRVGSGLLLFVLNDP